LPELKPEPQPEVEVIEVAEVAEVEEVEIDQELVEIKDHQDLMPTETQSHSSQESQNLMPMVTQFHSSQEPRNTRVKIEKTVPVKPEEKERKVEKEETTRRRELKKEPPLKLSRKSSRS